MPINTTDSKQINITALIFVYYSASATSFHSAVAALGSFHGKSLVTELRPNVDPC
jgi:hypothetical protein